MATDLHIRNISEVCLPEHQGPGVERLRNTEIIVRRGCVHWLGPAGTAPADAQDCTPYDARGGAVLPALVDCHTHLVFAGDRVDDFAERARGTSYAEIAARGGGILTTVEATRRASIAALTEAAETRLESRRRYGIGTTEIKSGYGLNVDDELKMLEVVAQLRSAGHDIEGTLLAAHTVPKDIDKERYLGLIVDQMIPEVAERRLARFVDVFIERGAYNVDDARRVFDAAKKHGLLPRVHADQITSGGGAELAAEVGATSADHLEQISGAGIDAMRRAGVIATLLPGAGIFLGDDLRGLGRRLVDAGLEVAVASDANPGSSPLMNLPLAGTLATTQMGLTAEESIRALTLGGAHVLRRPDVGDLRPGCRGRFIVLNHADPRSLIYAFGEPIVRDFVHEATVT